MGGSNATHSTARRFRASGIRVLLVAVVAAAGSVSLGSGCSFLFVEGPYTKPGAGGRPNPNCTKSYGWPVTDTVLTASQVAWLGVLASRPADSSGDDAIRKMQFGAALGWMIIYGASAIAGFDRVSDCRSEVSDDPRPRLPRLDRDQRKVEEAEEEQAVQRRRRQQRQEAATPAPEAPRAPGPDAGQP